MTTILFRVADFVIRLTSSAEIETEVGYQHFILDEDYAEPDISITCHSYLPENRFCDSQPIFEAANAEQKFYSIYRLPDRLAFVVYNQTILNRIQQVAYLSNDYQHWEVFSEPITGNKINPLKYPMGPIILHYLTINREAVMIHASCIKDGAIGRIFSGFSGAGKSTLSGIWVGAGCEVINDDRLIIRKVNDHFTVYNTPMYYVDRPKKTALNSIYLIRHATENRLMKLSGAVAVTKVLAFCIQNNFDEQFVHSNLVFLTDLCRHVAIYELGFVPDTDVIEFIRKNEVECNHQ